MEEHQDWNNQDYEKYSLEKPEDRLNFIRKVYILLSSQLLITALFVLYSVLSTDFQDFVYDNWWIMIISSILAIVPLLILFLSKKASRTVPINYILLTIFTLFESFTMACICAFYYPEVILIAFGCTAGLTIVLTIYAFVTKTDFTYFYGILIVVSFGLLVFLIIILVTGSDNIYRLVFCPLCVIFYGVYLIVDTQLIVGKKHHAIEYDDYVLGVVMLYVDIIGMFSYILAIFGEK